MGVATTVLLVLILLTEIALLVYFAVVGLPALNSNVNSLISFVNSSIGTVQGIAVNVFDEVSGLLSTAEAFVVQVAQNISSAIATGLNTVYSAILGLGNQIFDTLVSLFSSIKQFVTNLTAQVVSFYDSVISPIISVLVNIYNFIRDNIVAPVVNLINEIVAAINSL